nr:MAG TPA: hypothetical protein [Bacteriophage sp.]
MAIIFKSKSFAGTFKKTQPKIFFQCLVKIF